MSETERSPLLPKGPPNEPRQNLVLLWIGVWSMIFISSVDSTIVATLISTIGSSLESMQLSSWIGTSYLLSFCAFTPLYGRLANIFGRRPSVLFAGTLFGGGTVLCGFATTMPQLIAFRAIAGIGGGMTVVGSIIVSDSVPLRSRALHQGFANVTFAIGGAIGAPIGGWLGSTIGWRAAFIGQGPFVFFALFLLWKEIREPEFILNADRHSFFSKLKRVDYAGSASLVIGLLCFLVGMHFQTTAGYGWDNPRVWGLLTASAVVACAFVLIEGRFAPEPVMPLRMLKRRTPAFANLTMVLLSVFNFSTIYNVPLYFTAARVRSSAEAGVHLIPLSVMIAFGSVYTGWYMHKTGRYWWIQVFACSTVIVTSVALAFWDAATPEWILYTTLVPFGFGFAALSTTAILALISSVPTEEIPVATGLLFLSRVMGQVIGVSLSAALAQALLARNLRASIIGPGSAEVIEKILDSTEYIHTLPPDLQQKAAASWLGAIHVVFFCQIGLAVMVLLSALPIEENDLPGKRSELPTPTCQTTETRQNGTP
ncbi:MFS general substrate transporter [Mycena pura]|uniref:MFS general substrate transporter n=1 Tax=Mycena pura TaxID=153505 RepID=A0AAD6YJV1_9AGAR|nr:MFS general substrate transporter [Mycena pura]